MIALQPIQVQMYGSTEIHLPPSVEFIPFVQHFDNSGTLTVHCLYDMTLSTTTCVFRVVATHATLLPNEKYVGTAMLGGFPSHILVDIQ